MNREEGHVQNGGWNEAGTTSELTGMLQQLSGGMERRQRDREMLVRCQLNDCYKSIDVAFGLVWFGLDGM